MITIKIGTPDATVELNARKALDGSLMIMDHKKIDIAVMPDKMKVVTFPKTTSTEDVYDYQNRLLELLADKGVIERSSIQGGNVFRSLEADEKELEDMYTHPDDRDSTEYGEVPQYGSGGTMRPGYYYYPLRNRY